jgi:hypothetical protein
LRKNGASVVEMKINGYNLDASLNAHWKWPFPIVWHMR